jgi:hypothetical protein
MPLLDDPGVPVDALLKGMAAFTEAAGPSLSDDRMPMGDADVLRDAFATGLETAAPLIRDHERHRVRDAMRQELGRQRYLVSEGRQDHDSAWALLDTWMERL